jgi:hypothetical protein
VHGVDRTLLHPMDRCHRVAQSGANFLNQDAKMGDVLLGEPTALRIVFIHRVQLVDVIIGTNWAWEKLEEQER